MSAKKLPGEFDDLPAEQKIAVKDLMDWALRYLISRYGQDGVSISVKELKSSKNVPILVETPSDDVFHFKIVNFS